MAHFSIPEEDNNISRNLEMSQVMIWKEADAPKEP